MDSQILSVDGLDMDPDNPEYLAQLQNMEFDTLNFDKFENMTSLDDVVKFMDSNFATFLLSLLCAISWIVYITFYSSRITGLLATKIINRIFKNGYIKIGSLSFSVLSGKVMFRDVAFITEDCSYRVQDGWVIFRWWRTYVPKDISEDMSHSDTRLSILLNGFEYHLYNRSEFYSGLEKLFDLDPFIIPGGSKNLEKEADQGGKSHPKPPSAVGYSWRDLIPVIKLELSCGRVVFGNMLVPYTLALVVEEAHLIYTTKPAPSKLDHFMHIIKCKAENFKVLLSQSPKYTGLKDDPPRLMGEGFGIVTANKLEFYYYMDEPGVVPNEPEMVQLANGDLVEANPPLWGIDIKCGKGTDFSYGPWADRQREQLYKLFYPQDYQPLKPTSPPCAGELRQIQSFDIRLSTLTDATVDILFSRDQETNAIHMNVGPGSYLEVNIPWIVRSNGYTTKITGQLLHLEASTSLQYRNFLDSETLQFTVESHYPLHWNDHQDWTMNLTGCKASAYLIFAHKWFFQAMVNDWSSRTPPDILSFVPYTWKISFCLKEFEIMTATNEYNWIDCSSQNHENSLLAACGELFELSFDLPFFEFLPTTVLFKFWIQIEGGDLNFYVPEVSTAFIASDSLTKNAKVRNRDGSVTRNSSTTSNENIQSSGRRGKVKKWRNICQTSESWIECWSVPICAVSIAFNYHPMPPLGPSPQADVTTPEKEESLLSPMRIPGDKEVPKKVTSASLVYSDFDPLSLPPDHVHVECEVGPSVMLLYGALLKIIINLKENIFGDYQDFIDMEKIKCGTGNLFGFKIPAGSGGGDKIGSLDKIDPREYRPLEVTVSATLHDIRAHLLKNCSEDDPPCPTICVERFGFEMNKKFKETILQVLLSPVMLLISDTVDRSDSSDHHIKEGYLMLSGLQVRGHAMFSNEGRTLDQETLEYGWLVEVQLGKLSGRLTTPHVENIVSGCEAFLLTVLDGENSLRSPHPFLVCHHGNNQFECPVFHVECSNTSFGTGEDLKSETFASSVRSPSFNEYDRDSPKSLMDVCPTSEDIKYKLVRVSFDAIDIYLVESGSALSLWVSPIRFALCNLHGTFMKEGFSLLIPTIQLRHFVMVNPSFTKRFQFSDLNILQSSTETMTASWTSKVELNNSAPQSPTSTSANSWSYLWLEAGAVALGPLCIELAMKGSSRSHSLQNMFLIKHDKKTKRLWFLWKVELLKDAKVKEKEINTEKSVKKCGCIGGCAFFGSNIGGTRFYWPSRKDWIDGVNVACFRVNKPGEDYGFGQSILKPSVLVFDTPPYTTQQGVSILELPTEWIRDPPPKSGKAPYIFKPSLLADLSHTSSSIPSNRSDKMSTLGSTLQSNRGRRFSQPNQPGLKRQTRISDPSAQGSDSKLDDAELQQSLRVDGVTPVGRTSSCGSDSKLGVDYFQSFEEDVEDPSEIQKELRSSKSHGAAVKSTEVNEDATLSNKKKQWQGSINSLDSLSDLSFISALSVQEECMVNLQLHLNKPIVESSLLMPCYMSHLTQLKCDNWHVTAPAVASDSVGLAPFVQMQDGKLVYAGSKYTPYFDPLVDGFTTLAMVNMDNLGETTKATPSQSSTVNTPSQTHFWETPIGAVSSFSHVDNKREQSSDEEFYKTILCSETDTVVAGVNTEATTIIVRTKNDINIMVSPMLLEALKKFIEAVTPTLSTLHPLTVVNHLHNDCISRVGKANLLKKDKSVLLSKIQTSKRNTALRVEETSPEHSNVYEEISQTAIQGSISLPKINVTLLQASVVEEVISFSALDNIRDLMCVSLLALAIEQTQIHFLFRNQVKKSVQVLHRPVILPKAQKKRKSKVSASDSLLSEPVFIENSEKQSELLSTSVDIHRIHGQLRRLKNDSSILKEAVITAIPNQHSKVLFRFAKIPSGLQEMKENTCTDSSRDNITSSSLGNIEEAIKSDKEKDLYGSHTTAQSKCPDEKLGFIMFECGLEGISLKGVKNSESASKMDDKEETVSVTLCNEVYNHVERGSTPNVPSTVETITSDKEATIMETIDDKEEIEIIDGNTETPCKQSLGETEASEFEETEKDKGRVDKTSGAASVSCVIQFKVMWYNFAAPPQTPITRKIDYTRVDWNLVSTASTAINAWLNPIDQLTISIVSMLKGHSKRTSGLLASLMAEALEVQSIHQPMRSKYSKLTPLAKTLQEDPSCQLCIILERYIRQTASEKIEFNVSDKRLPPLSTLRQGVIVLSRQWKNVLYTPLLLEHSLKSRKSKNFTVTFTLPQSEEESPGSDAEMSVEETTDERATLLDMEGGTASLQSMRFNRRSRGSSGSTASEVSTTNNNNHKTLPSQPVLNSTRASDVYPLTENFNVNSLFNGDNNRDKRAGSVGSVVTGNWSLSSGGNENHAESGRSTPGAKRRNRSNIVRQISEWNTNNESSTNAPRLSAIMSEQSHEESLLLGTHSKFPQHPSLMLLDAHVIFQPLLTSMGLMPHQIMGYSLDHLGSHMSIKASIDTMRIDIVESEVKGVGRGSLKGGKNPNAFVLNISPETPAFLCEKIGLEGDFQKSTDLSRDVLNKKSVIYLSRNYWKKQAKSAVIFSLNIDYIAQQVNMPLLRLLHQITTMYQNVRETQMELREQRPSQNVEADVVHKNSSSSGSDIPDQLGTGTSSQTKPVAINTPTVDKESSASPNIAAMSNFNNTGTTSSSMKGSAIATRTQSFAQRFKTSARAVKGSKLNIDGTLRTSSASQTPTSLRGPDFPDSTPKPQAKPESTGISQPNCWRTIYYLLDLYATRPETKTIINNRPQLLHDSTDGDHARATRVPSTKFEGKDHLDEAEKGQSQEQQPLPTIYITSSLEKQKESPSEPPRFSIFVVARIQRTRLLASLSGLKLEAEIMNLQATCSYNKKMRPIAVDMSLTGHVGQAMIVLLEGIAPNQQTVVRVSIAKSGALYSGISRRTKDRNSGLLTIGPVHVDIPQHPVVLHGMMTRSTKQLSNTLQEFRVNRAASRISRGTTFDEVDFAAHLPHLQQHPVPEVVPEKIRKASDTTFFQPLHMQFSVTVDSLSITAALLPSLQAQYKMELVKSCGVTGSKAKFQINLPTHTLSFTTKLTSSEANLPSAASISLPHVDVSAEYIQDGKGPSDAHILDDVVLRHGSYLSASADIGSFEHCLTTDLLNHLVFVQKVFMKEVNEVVLKMSGGDKPVPLWEDEGSSSLRSLLFTLAVRLQGVQITATTPTNTAVRLETGLLEFQMSNRVQGMSKSKHHVNTQSTNNSSSSHPHAQHRHASINNKVFIKAQVDVNLSLGQLIRNIVFEEADSEYQQYAFFKTRIALRNALSEEISGADADKEVVLITLTRPLIYVQPVAVDKAILVWLNYKNAYEYWNEQRSSLNTEVLAAMPSQWYSDKPHIPSLHEQSSTLFLQLTVDDMGISIPLNPSPHTWSGRAESENRGAVVLTLESTSISACSSGSLVSKGRFNGLCFRFSDDMVSMDDWKPNLHDPSVMNFCVVSEGTYEVCSKTTSQHQQTDNAKWFLNVKWQMEGVDMHVDVNVGKQLSALGHTLTTLAAFEEDDEDDTSERENIFSTEDVPDYAGGVGTPGRSISQESVVLRRQKSTVGENLPSFLTDPSLGPRQKRSLLEKEMQERVSLIDEMKKAGASPSQIEDERKKLQELENFAFRDFRRDWIKKLRRQSTRASSKFGLGSTKPLQMRSKSLAMPTPESEKKFDVGSPVESASPPSTESSPREGPSRSHSLRFKSKQRVTFGETQRQCSVDSANATTPDDDDEYVGVWLEDGATDNESKGIEGKEFGGGHLTPGSSVSHKAQEPNVDLELDVKVFINSGKCVLHTKPKEEDPESRGRKRSERSGSGYDSLLHISSPVSSRKGKQNLSSSRIKSPFGSSACQTDVTVFHIPGLDVKVHYDSHTLYEERERDSLISSLNRPTHERSDSGSSSGTLGGFNLGSGRKSGTKKASLFAWITLHSVPEETIISPHILDFLEQTLEPIPIPMSQKSFDGSSIQTDAASGVASTYYASFPVDVVVYFHMQPSTFRFSCQPISRVECMLRLPSLDVVFSSKRAEAEHDEFSSPNLSSNSKSRSWRYSADLSGIKDKENQQLAVGGLSVTGCLSDFSVYIFHPYGAAKKAGEWSPLSDNERKDSVSMNVEFVKLHLSRSRKIHVTGGSQSGGESRSFHQNNSENQQAAIRFSSIIDIGSASFKYDMRRLTEILAFPKAWYRRSIFRRLFLGDLSTASMYDDEVGSADQTTNSGNSSPVFPQKSEDRRNSITFGISPAQKEKLRLNFESEQKRRGSKLDFFAGTKSSKGRGDEGKEPASGISYWETLVLFTVNFTKLNVHMNMGNVMGNVNWLIRGAKSDGRISIGSTGHKNVYVSVGLDSSYIDAKGGIVAGTFELTQLNAFGRVKEDPGVEPHHNIGLKMYGVELRLDFMGTSVLMTRVSALEVTLKDEWHVRPIHRSQKDVALATYRPAMIFIHGDMAWDQLQLMISKSTTVDLLKMHCKLEEFFSQQFKSSKYVFSTLQVQETSSLTPSMPRKAKRKLPEGGLWEELRHHRHWQEVLEKVSRMCISSMPISLPDSGTVLGGTMDLHGNNISLACFHGVNFKAKSWALFSLKEAFISFSTEAQETHSSDSGSVHVIQNLNFSLGQQNQHALTISSVQHESMAMVCRITRNVMFPPQFRTLHEWFHYAFAPSEIDDVQRFPSLEKERERVERERADSGGSERRTPARLHDPNHNREVIFALPSLELFFKTEHLQACKTPDSTGNRPVVECSFITEFGDHIFVTVDAEAFFFLHDLITSYVKEKEKLVSAQLAAGRSQSPSARMDDSDGQTPSSSVPSPPQRDTNNLNTSDGASSQSQLDLDEAALQRDWRDYLCKTWQLEPTVRLLSWAGKSIEPYGVDYILHKLGFSHARITIPKWMQRGFCDPLDKVLSVLVFRMIDIARRENRPSTHQEGGTRH